MERYLDGLSSFGNNADDKSMVCLGMLGLLNKVCKLDVPLLADEDASANKDGILNPEAVAIVWFCNLSIEFSCSLASDEIENIAGGVEVDKLDADVVIEVLFAGPFGEPIFRCLQETSVSDLV